MSTKLSLSSASPSRCRAALSSPLTRLANSPTRSSLSSTAADTPGTTQTFGAKLTVDAVSSIANSPSAELDTPSVKKGATLPSELAIQIWLETWLMSYYMVGLQITYFKKIILFQIWLICLPAVTSACILKDTLRNDTQVFLEYRDSMFEICLHLINLKCTSYFLPPFMLSNGAGTSKGTPLKNPEVSIPAILITLSFSFFKSGCSIKILFNSFIKLNISSNVSIESVDSDVFFVEQISNEPSPQCNISPNILNSNEISHTQTAGRPSVSSIASPEPQTMTIHDDSKQPTMPYGFGRQLPIVPPSLNDLNLPPNQFNILATMAVVIYTHDGNNDNYSPQLLEPSKPSPITTPPMNVSTFDSWEKSHTTTDDNTFYSDDDSRRIYFLPLTPTPPPPPRKLKKKMSLGRSFPKVGGVTQHLCEACGQTIPSAKVITVPSDKTWNLKNIQTHLWTIKSMKLST